MSMKNDTITQLKDMLPDYLNMIGINTNKPFNCLNPNHADHNPSMSFDRKDGQHIKCFSCDAYWDIFDLIAVRELHASVDGNEVQYNFNEAYNKALQILGVNTKPLTSKGNTEQKHERTERNKQRDEERELNARIIETANSLLDSEKFNPQNATEEQKRSHSLGIYYLRRRGISEDLARRFKLGFLSYWKSSKAILRGDSDKIQGTPRLIIPTSNYSYIARDSRDEIPKAELKYKKMKDGYVHIFNEKALAKNQPIFIVEGEIDALSIMETGKAEAIGLGSIANINLFMKEVRIEKQKRPDDFYPTFLVALDNDQAGQRATNMLTAQLNKINATNYVVHVARGHKDANEALTDDRGQFILDVEKALKDPSNRLQGLLDYISQNEAVEAIPPGFANLDNVLDGGLYEGLYGIGAISSLGKTTLVLQIADYIAQVEQRPVLYFALEMGMYEMMCKSISRITFEYADHLGDTKLAQTTRSILKGKWKERFNKAQYDNVMNSFKKYGDYYNNVIIHDGSEKRPTIFDISKEVSSYVARTGKKPVVIIDYLQILKAANERATDKTNVTTSVNEMKKLATRFHIPVIVISSFNRFNYKNAVTMEAFKESGDIEYSTDVLIGLQLQGTGEQDFDVNEAKKKNPREIEAVVLKNRNGRTGDTLNFAYYPMFNKFCDMDEVAEETPQTKPKTQVDAEGRVTSPTNSNDFLGWGDSFIATERRSKKHK